MKRSFKKNNSSIRKTRKIKKHVKKINIHIDWDSKDNGYSSLNNNRVLRFMMNSIKNGYNLIQTQPKKPFYCKGKTTLYLQAVKVKSWPVTPNWDWHGKKDYIKCITLKNWIKISPCTKGSKNAKVMVKLKSNPSVGGFATYLMSIFSGYITLNKHKEFVKAIQQVFKHKPAYIHNQDVDWFHIKEYIKQKHKQN